MKTYIKTILLILSSTILVVSCSRKKDKFISRNFHAVTTEFNVLFNGYNALEAGRDELNQSYADNYWDVLPIERMQIRDEIVLPGQSENPNFSRAEEKAIKAIQKHSMNIRGKEKNPQIDEAYLLLGKSRYFDQRFIPALEAFNYILYKYPGSDKINQAKIWREKTNIRLDNNDLAIKNLERLIKQEDVDDQDLADASSMLAQAYLNEKAIDSAIIKLEIAAIASKKNDERGRYRFIQGQLYNKLGYKDSANVAFDKVIKLNRKTTRIYMICAYLEKVKNFDFEKGDTLETAELLTKLEENRENRPYLDKIYHQIGEFNRFKQSDSVATVYYNKSLRAKSTDKRLKARNYEILGDMNFDETIYKTAGEYFDSTMANLVKDSKPFRIIKRKRDNLKDVIYYETIAQVNDSILNLVELSDADRLAYFENHIEKLKLQEEEEKKKAKLQEALKRNNGLAVANNTIGPKVNNGGPNNPGVFYFYNPTTVAYGKNEFVKIWGDRSNEDNWRWSSKAKLVITGVDSISGGIASKLENPMFNPEFYISEIPSEEKVIDSISKERNYAYYQLGLIYKEKFKEYKLAKNKLLNLLNSDPEEKLILPSKYNLYKIYELLGEYDEASIAREDIILKYPESRYAAILLNPELVSDKDENSPESLYEVLYEKSNNQEYAEVIYKSEEYIKRFDGEPMVPKFELLKAMAIGRLCGFEDFKKAITNVAVTYANTEEGKQAQNMQTNLLPLISRPDFFQDYYEGNGSYKVVFQFKNPETEKIIEFQKILEEVLESIRRYYDLKSSVDLYDENTKLVVIHGFNNAQIAETFDQLLSKENKKKIKKPYFAISSDNYKVIQIHKNIDAYLSRNKK